MKNSKLFPLLIVFIFVAVLMFGCSKSNGTKSAEKAEEVSSSLTSLTISPSSVTLEVGSTQQFSAKAYYSSQSLIKTITPTWSVVGGVGTISATGLFTAGTKDGVGKIIAKHNEISKEVTVKVTLRTVSGFVYDGRNSAIYNNDLQPIANATIYIDGKSTTSKSDGSFSISEVPAGQVNITIVKDGYATTTLVSNKSLVKLFPSQTNIPFLVGKATFTGKVSGLPASVTSLNGSAYCGALSYSNFSYDNTLSTYTQTKAPNSGETYLFAYYVEGNENIYSYKKFNASSGINKIDLAFGLYNKFSGTVTPPSGFKSSYLSISATNTKPYVSTIMHRLYYGNLAGTTSFNLEKVPKLQTGDSYSAYAYVANNTNPGQSISHFQYNLSSGSSLVFDLSSYSGLVFKTPTPADGSIVSTHPTISWNAVGDKDTVYAIRVYSPSSSVSLYWSALTDQTTITVPSEFKVTSGKEYRVSLVAISGRGFDINDFSSLMNAYVDTLWYTQNRSIYYGSKSASATSFGVKSKSKAPRSPYDIFYPNLSY